MVTVAELLTATAGELRQGDAATAVSAMITDSRAIKPGAAFFALSGEKFDGHAYAAQAANAGAVCVVVSKPVEVPAATAVILVKDVLTAYQ